MDRLPRMKPSPSRSWATVDCTATFVSPTGCGPESVGARTGGGDGGSVQQNAAATRYSAATMRITACGPAMLITSGPSSANPSAKAALSVSVNTPFAARSWLRGTTSGIIAASAGAKNTVTVETKMLSNRISRKLSPTRNSPMIAIPRSTFVATSTRRRSIRST